MFYIPPGFVRKGKVEMFGKNFLIVNSKVRGILADETMKAVLSLSHGRYMSSQKVALHSTFLPEF